MTSFVCLPLSRLIGIEKGHEIRCEVRGEYYYVNWGRSSLAFPSRLITDIKNNFFKSSDWYLLGASMDAPSKGGLGEYLQIYQHIWEQHSPRFASMIAAIMVHCQMIEFRKKGNGFELRKIT